MHAIHRSLFLVALLLCMSLAGCTSNDASGSNNNMTEDEKQLPEWSVGQNWLYTFITPQFGEDSARLVVAEIDNGSGEYVVGISSEREAQRHAVINHNPFLGRMTMDALAVYENGEPQQVFSFPWNVGDAWSFTLFGQVWDAQTVSLQNGNAQIEAESDEGHELTYTFSGSKGFLERLVWRDAEGTIPSNSGDYSLTVTVRGPSSFIHLKVAGALVFQWTL